MGGKKRSQARTPAEWLNTIAQAARAFRYMHEELDLSDETYNRLKKRLIELAAEHDEARLASQPVDSRMRVRSNRNTK